MWHLGWASQSSKRQSYLCGPCRYEEMSNFTHTAVITRVTKLNRIEVGNFKYMNYGKFHFYLWCCYTRGKHSLCHCVNVFSFCRQFQTLVHLLWHLSRLSSIGKNVKFNYISWSCSRPPISLIFIIASLDEGWRKKKKAFTVCPGHSE